MIQNKRFEVFGTLTKTETVFTIEDKNLPGTLGFEALKPFPDYYFDNPMGAKPVYLYLALEEQFIENGIHFLQKTKKFKDELVKIKIIKFSSLKEITAYIYLDKREKNHAYLEIPRHLSWEEFENITNKVKYN